MNDLLTICPPLSARVARVARDIAEVIEARCSPESEACDSTAFLREWAAATDAEEGLPAVELDRLATAFSLTDDERRLLVLAGLPDEHEGIATTFRAIHPHGEPRPTAGLAALLLGGSADDRARVRQLLTTGAAVTHGLLQVASGSTFFERSLLVPGAIWDVLHGFDAWPTELERVLLGPPPPGLGGWLDTADAAAAVDTLAADRAVTVMVLADEDAVAFGRASSLAAAAGRDVVAARADAGDAHAWKSLAAHAAARGAMPVLIGRGLVEGISPPTCAGDVPGAAIVCAPAGAVRPSPHRAVLALSADAVSPDDQRVAWAAAVPALRDHADALAARHPIDPAITAQLAADVKVHDRDLDLGDVAALIRTRAAATLPAGVQLETPKVPWSHIVLPEDGARQLRDAVARLDHQRVVLEEWGLRDRAHASRGARLLFTGPPGTGKSLAAAAVATAAHTDLLVCDVSRVVSKWLGETEKNLSAAFDAAERTQAVLLLDEADVVFGTRTEISDAHDRYANLETAYLLHRLDRFDGIAVLTTNLRANIDVAFMRRMDFVVDFALPDEDARAALWHRHLPPEAVAEDVDAHSLAAIYPVPGAWIRNAAVAGAFAAAATRGLITQEHLVAAMRREYAKSALPFPGEPPRRRHDAM